MLRGAMSSSSSSSQPILCAKLSLLQRLCEVEGWEGGNKRLLVAGSRLVSLSRTQSVCRIEDDRQRERER